MSDQALNTPQSKEHSQWGPDMQMVICERCDWRFLLPAGSQLPRCPHCFLANLTPFEQGDNEPGRFDYCPELVAPFTVSAQAIDSAIQHFADGIPYAPHGLDYATLRARLFPVYLPMWLVDSPVDATWQAEAGFNYQVVSHQEQFDQNRGGWNTRQVNENRIRWEPRIGRLQRVYQNIPAPAMEEDKSLRAGLGDYDLSQPVTFHPKQIEGTSVRLPDRTPQDAWSDAAAAFQELGAREVKAACDADHLRQFRWTATFSNRNWTLLLLPAYTTYYLDDDNQPQPVMIHGQTGRVSGSRRASMARAQRSSLVFLGIGLAIFLLGLILGAVSVAIPPLAPFAVLAVIIGLPGSLAAVIPVTIAWNFNRKQVTPG
jgi:hypothetical protein